MRAVGAVILRRALHSSFTCLRCTPIASASAPCVKPRGRMNSSTRISPTVAGLRLVVSMHASPVAMVVALDDCGLAAADIPLEDQSPLWPTLAPLPPRYSKASPRLSCRAADAWHPL